jgi:hypothetical protein
MSVDALRFRRTVEPQVGSDGQLPDSPDQHAPMSAAKWLTGAFSAVLLLVVASPVIENWKSPAHDDFPLSYFRMFSEERADTQRVNYLVGIDAEGARFLIPYKYVGPGGMNQVREQINKRVKDGKSVSLCQTVATRVAKAGSRLPALSTIEVTSGIYRLSEYFTGQQAPSAEIVRARCAVARSKS